MWTEWAMGRYGGSAGHGTTPALFSMLSNSSISRYLGIFGLWIPLVVVTYYIYIESWTLGYSLHFLLGSSPKLAAGADTAKEYVAPFSTFLGEYTGAGGDIFHPSSMAITAFAVTLVLNFLILFRGISKGIEIFAKIALPLLFIMALILFFRVLTLDTDNGSAAEGLNFLWNPDFKALINPGVWVAAAGQIFFTLSLGFGAIITYASYIKPTEDITLGGLTSASINGATEIAIPAAVVFFGVAGAVSIAHSGAFNLGFISLPAIFASMPAGQYFGFLWFFLLFFAGLTSSVALMQPVITFFQDEYGLSHSKSVLITIGIVVVSVVMVIFVNQTVDEWDFWAGTIGIVLFGFIEVIMFMWVFGGENAWRELNRNELIKLPRLFYYILRYVTPVFLFIIMIWWGIELLPEELEKTSWTIWLSRAYLVMLFIMFAVLVKFSGKRKGGMKDGN